MPTSYLFIIIVYYKKSSLQKLGWLKRMGKFPQQFCTAFFKPSKVECCTYRFFLNMQDEPYGIWCTIWAGNADYVFHEGLSMHNAMSKSTKNVPTYL